ncbi:hypothetical protein L6Q21_16420, partial [Sandaracinobacter sp. RS1-74]|uniref:hypothetical protein n=1 Tax=Sandaracinobacteroides sayramensis TaxID=2913411 RepID=UPI001EDB0246
GLAALFLSFLPCAQTDSRGLAARPFVQQDRSWPEREPAGGKAAESGRKGREEEKKRGKAAPRRTGRG